MVRNRIACEKITSIDELIKQEFVIFKAWDGEMKVYHAGWFRSWQLQYIESLIIKGWLYYAIKEECKNELCESDCLHEGTLPSMSAAR